MAKSITDRIVSLILGTLAALFGLAMLPHDFIAFDNWETLRSYKDPLIGGWHAAFPMLANCALTLVAFYMAARFFYYSLAKAKQD